MSGTSPGAPLAPSEERRWAVLAHLGNILTFVPSLLILLILGGRSDFVRRESREALNLSLTALITWVALAVLGQVFGFLADQLPAVVDLPFVVLRFLSGLAQLAVWVVVVVLSVVAATRVPDGGGYRYPLALRLVR